MNPDVNWPAAAVGAFATFALGGIWYGPLFGRVRRKAEAATEPMPPKAGHPAIVHGVSFVLMLIAAPPLAVALRPAPELGRSVGVGLAIGLG